MSSTTPMQLGMIGLGRMGANLVRRLMRDGHRCVVYDVNPDAVKALVDSVINFQERSLGIVAEMRDLATKNSAEIRDAVEAGKKRIARLATAAQALPDSLPEAPPAKS